MEYNDFEAIKKAYETSYGTYESFLKFIKEAYEVTREEERKRIIDYLASQTDEDGPLFTKIDGDDYKKHRYNRGRGGRSDYTSDGNLIKEYDLSNWKWIETCYKGYYVFISLQSYDIDPGKTKNLHVLYDRLGILYEDPSKTRTVVNGKEVSDAFTKMQTTEFELPLSNKDMADLVEMIKGHFEDA